MAYEEENKREVFYIPQNYEDAGGIMGGHFKQRNIIETCVVCLPILIAEYNFIDLPLSTKIVIILVTVLPLACLFALGIKGESVTQIVLAFFRYLRNRRRLSFVGFVDKGQRSFMPDPWALETLKESIKQRGFLKAIIKAISDTKKLRKIRRDLSIEIEIRENGQQVVVRMLIRSPRRPNMSRTTRLSILPVRQQQMPLSRQRRRKRLNQVTRIIAALMASNSHLSTSAIKAMLPIKTKLM